MDAFRFLSVPFPFFACPLSLSALGNTCCSPHHHQPVSLPRAQPCQFLPRKTDLPDHRSDKELHFDSRLEKGPGAALGVPAEGARRAQLRRSSCFPQACMPVRVTTAPAGCVGQQPSGACRCLPLTTACHLPLGRARPRELDHTRHLVQVPTTAHCCPPFTRPC